MLAIACVCSVEAQTYKIAPDATTKSANRSSSAHPTQSAPVQATGQSLGFGSNILNARLAQAAEQALKQGNHAQAVDYAQRAAQAAPNDAQLWFLLGYAARLDQKYSLSVEAYQHGLRLNPSGVEGLSGLAQTYAGMGRTDEAERLLKQVIASNPGRRDDALLLGNLYMRAGDYTGALDWLNRAERMKPDARSELLLAITYQHLKQLDKASHYLNLARQRDPNNPDVQRSLAGYYRETGDYKGAIAALLSIRNPKPDVKAELAYTYQLDGKMEESARLYAQAANAMPRNLDLQLSAAQAQVAAGSIDDAQPFLERAERLNANYYRLHAIRGQIAQLQDRDEDALREYTAALANLPATPAEGPLYGIQLHMNLMELNRSLNNTDAARQQLATAQAEIGKLDEQGAGRAPFLRLRALIKLNTGDLDSALTDMKEALAISPHDPSNLQLDGDLLMKLGRTEDAIVVYKRVLAIDPKNRFALTSIGYASRAAGRDSDAEKYFRRLERAYPNLYVPYLALGDMYTAHRQFKKAQASYTKAYALAPKNALITAGGMNAAIEAHQLDVAGTWLNRATDPMRQDTQMLRERERYLSFRGDYQQSADVGRQAIEVLPHDRDVVVYLGYDLLHLEKYDELLQLTGKYAQVFPKEPDIPLLAGYVHKHKGDRELALQDFTLALERDPNVVTAYVNRGFVLNDLHKPDAAAADFEAAIQREPKNGEAHLGLAYADLDLHKPQAAVRETELVEQEMGDSELIHTIRATAYGREGLLTKAAGEYRAALKFTPNDGTLYLGLGDTLYAQRRYHDAVDQLLIAQKLAPDNASVYTSLARAYAHLQDRAQTLHYVELAEQHAQQAQDKAGNGAVANSDIYIATGEALSTLGDQKAAMERFARALTVPNSDRVSVRLAIAQLMVQQDHPQDAQRQIALALMEAEAGETAPLTGSQFIGTADLFRQMHEYQLSQTYLGRAKAAGASDISVRIGLANNYLALGDTARAAGELAAISHATDSENDYQYLLAKASVYQQEHQGSQALTAFAQAASAAGEDQTAEQNLLLAGANEGYRVNSTLSLLSNFFIQPIFEDSTVYVLDSKLDGPVPVPPTDPALLPPPRSSLETQETIAYHLHLNHLPTASGFFQLDNAQGTISVPQTSSIVKRNTTNYSLNFGLNPTFHLGRNVVTFNSGIQGTLRRDSLQPVDLNQNLFRAFTYMQTSSFFNAVSASGFVIYERGPFTDSDEHSRATSAALDFRVGQPWGKTALVTGWGASDQQFTPVGVENYYTSSYIGLTRRFSTKWNVEALAEYLRAWRVVGTNFGNAQVLRPAGTVNYAPTRNWDLQATSAYSSTRSFHVYDVTQNGFSVSYIRPLRRTGNDEDGKLHFTYPIRFTAGFKQETFFNFSHGQNQQFRPYIGITLF
jgi:tetratricopeptide (TPR) repeat protein